jgi:hypothetical protein
MADEMVKNDDNQALDFIEKCDSFLYHLKILQIVQIPNQMSAQVTNFCNIYAADLKIQLSIPRVRQYFHTEIH